MESPRSIHCLDPWRIGGSRALLKVQGPHVPNSKTATHVPRANPLNHRQVPDFAAHSAAMDGRWSTIGLNPVNLPNQFQFLEY
jgi:hypothetical protein